MDKGAERDARVMKAIESAAGEGIEWFGVAIATGLSVGTVYPILIRLEREKRIQSVRLEEGGLTRYVYRL